MVHTRYPFRFMVEEQRAMGHYHQYLRQYCRPFIWL